MIRIGIPCRTIDGRYVVNRDYVQALAKAGADSVLILPTSDLSAILPTLQGILIPGGGDVDPTHYEEANTMSDYLDSETDRLDLAVIHAALDLKLPLFGICRGLQIINVALGGSLIQDIPSAIQTTLDHQVSVKSHLAMKGHGIHVVSGSRLANLLPESIEVNSYHHQAIKKLADGLSVSAKADDGIIEAVEGTRILAVQWHPERMTSDPLFQGLFDDFVKRCL